MSDLSGLTRTIVASAVTLLCSTIFCAAGVYTTTARGGGSGLLSSDTGVPMVLFGLLVWVVPPLVWSRSGWSKGEDSEEE